VVVAGIEVLIPRDAVVAVAMVSARLELEPEADTS
jgi:hypothetical protein